jgi:phosphoglycolate phosphatase
MTQRTFVFEGIPELISRLRALGLPWGVVTNKSMRFTAPLTQSMSLFATAGAVVGGDSTPHPKPHPAPLLEAARQLNLPAAQCIYVGDDERDVVAGRAAGMGTVAATYGYLGSNADTLLWGADAHIRSPLELLPLLKSGPKA